MTGLVWLRPGSRVQSPGSLCALREVNSEQLCGTSMVRPGRYKVVAQAAQVGVELYDGYDQRMCYGVNGRGQGESFFDLSYM